MSSSIYTELELQKLVADIRRSQEETDKFAAEQKKLIAEAAKLERDRKLAPIVIASSIIGGLIAGLISIVVKVLGG